MILESITIYPVKALRGVPVQEATVEPWGLAGDRRWMVVDSAGRCLTQREVPGMTAVAAALDDAGVILSAPGMHPLHVPAPDRPAEVTIWGGRVPAQEAGPNAATWLTSILGHPCRLVHMGNPAAARPLDAAYAQPGDTVSFADGFPLLAINTASLDDLNARLAQPVPANRFRSNLVVSGTPAWAEDGWRLLRVGGMSFRVPKPCARCVVITVDQDTGTKPRDREPLRTLTGFRGDGAGHVLFGQNLVPDGKGRIAVGMSVEAAADTAG